LEKKCERDILLKKRKFAEDYQPYHLEAKKKMIRLHCTEKDATFVEEKKSMRYTKKVLSHNKVRYNFILVQKESAELSRHVRSLATKILDFLEKRRKKTRKDVVEHESREIIQKTAREELTYCDSLLFLLKDPQSEMIGRNSASANKYSVWKRYAHVL
jgi:hypothetical protein